MYKKFLAFSAASAIAFVACSPDNSTAPFEDVSYNSSSSQIVSSSSVQDIRQNSDNSNLQTPGSSSSELFTPQSSSSELSTPQTFSKNECTVKKLSDNTVEANTVVAGQAATKTTMVFVGDMVEIESSMTYDASLPDSYVEEQCTESKSLATDFDATVTCSKRNITAKMKQPVGDHSIDDIIKSSQATCDAMNLSNVPDTTVKPPVDNPPVPPQDTNTVAKPSGPAKATCQIIEDTDNLFKMKVVVEDSVTATVEAIFQNGSFTMKEVDEFDSKVAQSSVDQECTDSKAEAADEIKEFEEAGVDAKYAISCEGHVITESLSMHNITTNIMPMIAAPLIGECDQIQETGVIPDDDE